MGAGVTAGDETSIPDPRKMHVNLHRSPYYLHCVRERPMFNQGSNRRLAWPLLRRSVMIGHSRM